VQELCTRASPPWRAGFLLTDPPFTDWSSWRPEGPTCIAVDYASEHVDEIRVLLSAVIHRGPEAFARSPVRVVLVERDAVGPWMERLIGSRSAGYAFEQTRSRTATVEVGPMSDDELWQGVEGVLESVVGRARLRDDLIAALHTLDPERRPLFALLAADAVAAGRTIGAWDRERLLRDVLARERAAWAAHGVSAEYENLLALATMTGGLTEDVLDAPPSWLSLPAFRDFDRASYRAMTGAALEGDALPPLKPDLLGEFFVLEHVRGRNERVTAQRAAELAGAAWQVRGGSRRVVQFSMLTHVLPSSVPLFLRRVVDDYADHPAMPHLLARADGADIDLFFWPELVAHAIGKLADAGRMADAIARFDELTALSPEQQRTLLGTSATIAAMFSLLPHAFAHDSPLDAAALIERVQGEDLRSHDGTAQAFARGAAAAVHGLIAAGRPELAEELLARVRTLVGEFPDEAELRASYAHGTSHMVTAGWPLADREKAYERLQEFCLAFREDVALLISLALAAGSLCRVYIDDAARHDDAERMNRVVRTLARMRAEQRLVRVTSTPEDDLPMRTEIVEEDLRTIRLELAETNVLLIPSFVLAERHAEARALVDEIERISPRNDADFAAMWALGVARHADASALAGHVGQVQKALGGIIDAGTAFPGDRRFATIASNLALNSLKRAARTGDLAFAGGLLNFLNEAAGSADADARLVAEYAEGALVLSTVNVDRGDEAEAYRIVTAARLALQSPAAHARWLERGNADTAAEIRGWVDAMLAGA
jgi:hypothetical protein